MCKDRQKGLGDEVNLPRVWTPPHLTKVLAYLTLTARSYMILQYIHVCKILTEGTSEHNMSAIGMSSH